MPTREEVKRLFSRGPLSRRPSGAPPAAAAQPRQTLKPPPEGYAYVEDPVHGYVLVQVALPAAPGAGGPRSRLVGPDGTPVPARGPALQRSSQLLRPGIDPQTHAPCDKYQEFLGRVPDLARTPEREMLFRELVPELSIMDAYAPPQPLRPELAGNAPVESSANAWGSRQRSLNVGDLG